MNQIFGGLTGAFKDHFFSPREKLKGMCRKV